MSFYYSLDLDKLEEPIPSCDVLLIEHGRHFTSVSYSTIRYWYKSSDEWSFSWLKISAGNTYFLAEHPKNPTGYNSWRMGLLHE